MQDQGTEIQRPKVLRPTTNSKYTVYEILCWVFQKNLFFLLHFVFLKNGSS